ncbi:MAG: energy transducer TonB [Gemmatimonadota bacterium]
MTDRHDEDVQLPEDLRALHDELLSIQYEERPSFGPELRAELAHEWATMPRTRPLGMRRHLAAAVLAAVLVGGASVPSARASFIRLIEQIGPEQVAIPVSPIEVVAPAYAAPAPEGNAPVAEAPEAEAVEESEPPPVEPTVPDLVTPPVLTPPEMIDRDRSSRLLQSAYPRHLQRRGVGGIVWLRLWVDESGLPGQASVLHTSGVDVLDRVATNIAPRFMFEPALEDGEPVGKWIEFPVLFEPDSVMVERPLRPAVDPLSLPIVPQIEWWQMREPIVAAELPPMHEIGASEVPAREEGLAMLTEAFLDPAIVDAHGPAEAILSAEPPAGFEPLAWRGVVGEALEASIASGGENAAAMLALGRIRARQGLRTEARALFEGGLQSAVADADAGVDVSPWIVAELHYERSAIVRGSWLSSQGVGRVFAEAFSEVECRQASSTGGAGSGYASTSRLVAWNYLCPAELAGIFQRGFEETDHGSARDLGLMMGSLRAAIESYPAHVGANTDLLMALVDADRWDDVLRGARRFVHVSGGHPNGLLLAGMALQRLDRSAEAEPLFRAALARMDQRRADQLSYVGYLLDESDLLWYRRVASDERRSWEAEFWAEKDRRPNTEVNERWVEHLTRTTYASLRFGSVFGDAPEVWVRFGGPTTIHVVEDGSGRLAEFWDYGRGPDITFIRWDSSARRDLTPEGRAYVDDLGKIFSPQ